MKILKVATIQARMRATMVSAVFSQRARPSTLAPQSDASIPEPLAMPRARNGKMFDLLFSMPLDIVFEVASHLAPQDLLTLSRTNKTLHGTLHSPNASSVWKAVRSAVGAPDCSPGFTEPQWASLLFGRPICEQCGSKNVHNVEFGIRRRVCIRCKKQHLVSAAKLKKVFGYKPLILDMVPYTLYGGWVPSHCKRSPGNLKYFWKSDVECIASQWADLQGNIRMDVGGAEAEAIAYRKQRIDEVERITQHAKFCNDWSRQVSETSHREAYEKQIARFDMIRERLLALGYDDRDIHYSMFNRSCFNKDVEFTDQFWARIQSRAIKPVESNRVSRLERERDSLRVERLAILRPLYVEYAKSLAPLQWCYLPNIYELVEFPVLRNIMEADRSAGISQQSFLPVTGQLPALIPEWISAKKERIISMLEPPPSRMVDHPLDLATSVFVCTSQNCHNGSSLWWGTSRVQLALISWEAIAARSCQATGTCLYASYNSTAVGFSQSGASTASSLVRLANLDPSSATIAEMDALDLRFACLQCPALAPESRLVKGYPWKSAVEHGMTTEHANWYRMSPEETQRIRQNEAPVWDSYMAWSCNHCADDFNRWRTKISVTYHLGAMHNITSPTEPSDLFWYPGKHRIPSLTLASTEIVAAPLGPDDSN
ncbi:hypothetical protein BD779DRAFT_1789089 [Infundibulicybe gibba]|nr:hypothetical protein BD779DRAFT_1789089 [Infundibulicybe gibba]